MDLLDTLSSKSAKIRPLKKKAITSSGAGRPSRQRAEARWVGPPSPARLLEAAGKAGPRAILKYLDISKVSAHYAALPRQALEALRETAVPPPRPDDMKVLIGDIGDAAKALVTRAQDVADCAPPAVAEAAITPSTGFAQNWVHAAPSSHWHRATSPQMRALRLKHCPIGWAQHARPELTHSYEGRIEQVGAT